MQKADGYRLQPRSKVCIYLIDSGVRTRISDRIFAKLQWKKACTVDNFIEISGFAVIHCMYSASHFSRNPQSYKISVETKITPVYYDCPGDYLLYFNRLCINFWPKNYCSVGWLSFPFKRLTALWIHVSFQLKIFI